MEKRIGIFYGVSVGPGDPELMTLQAVRRLENCPVIAAPQTPKGGMLALDIAKGAVDLSGKTILPLRFAMSLDPAVQKAAHIEAARAVKEYLDAGQDVAMLNLGDVSVYATFGYLQEILEAEGCKTVMLPGVTSFCAAAARLIAFRLFNRFTTEVDIQQFPFAYEFGIFSKEESQFRQLQAQCQLGTDDIGFYIKCVLFSHQSRGDIDGDYGGRRCIDIFHYCRKTAT